MKSTPRHTPALSSAETNRPFFNHLSNCYDLALDQLPVLYRRLLAPVRFADGMVISLGISYWVRQEHLDEIESAIPALKSAGVRRLSELLAAIRMPARARQFASTTGLSNELARSLKHDCELWLPKAQPLAALELFQQQPQLIPPFAALGLATQLDLISAGHTPAARQDLAQSTGLPLATVAECVRYCDAYRTGKNLDYIRTKIYYAMGLDTWQKWAAATAEEVIARFTAHVQAHGQADDRLPPRPKEVRTGIEWAKLHLELFAVEW